MTPEQEEEFNRMAQVLFEKYQGRRLHGFGLRLRAVQFEFGPNSPHETEPFTYRIQHHFNKGYSHD